jgi:hypothetical protein
VAQATHDEHVKLASNLAGANGAKLFKVEPPQLRSPNFADVNDHSINKHGSACPKRRNTNVSRH